MKLTIEIPKELLAELRPFYSSLITDEEMVSNGRGEKSPGERT